MAKDETEGQLALARADLDKKLNELKEYSNKIEAIGANVEKIGRHFEDFFRGVEPEKPPEWQQALEAQVSKQVSELGKSIPQIDINQLRDEWDQQIGQIDQRLKPIEIGQRHMQDIFSGACDNEKCDADISIGDERCPECGILPDWKELGKNLTEGYQLTEELARIHKIGPYVDQPTPPLMPPPIHPEGESQYPDYRATPPPSRKKKEE